MSSPRERLLVAASDLVRRYGVAGTGLSALLAESGTARGSIYQHFPGGKDELIEAATDVAGAAMQAEAWAAEDATTPEDVVRVVVGQARRALQDEDFARGCPVVAAAVAGPEHPGVVAAASRAFRSWTQDLARVFREAGVAAGQAESFSSVLISAIEGAIVQARATQTLDPLDAVAEHLSRAAEDLAAR